MWLWEILIFFFICMMCNAKSRKKNFRIASLKHQYLLYRYSSMFNVNICAQAQWWKCDSES